MAVSKNDAAHQGDKPFLTGEAIIAIIVVAVVIVALFFPLLHPHPFS